MLKVLLFNIVYKESHFISIEYIYIFGQTFPSRQAGISSTVSSFLLLLRCYSYVISLLFPEFHQDAIGIQTFKYACLYSCNIIYLTVPRL